jgi:hypothetical protein
LDAGFDDVESGGRGEGGVSELASRDGFRRWGRMGGLDGVRMGWDGMREDGQWRKGTYGVFRRVPANPPMEPEMKLFRSVAWGVCRRVVRYSGQIL